LSRSLGQALSEFEKGLEDPPEPDQKPPVPPADKPEAT